MSGLVERLRAMAGEPFGRFAGEKDQTLALVYVADATEAASRIEALEGEVERLRDSLEGTRADPRCAVQTAYNRGAVEWARLNYRDMIPWLESQAVQSEEESR